MKKKLILCMLIALGAIMATSCSSDSESVSLEDLQLNVSSLSLYVGDSKQLIAKAYPEEASLKGLQWSVSDDIVTVSDDGLVTAMKTGTTSVTVSTKDSKVSKTITVTVLSPIEFQKEDYFLSKGETYKAELKYFNEYAKTTQLEWSSSDKSIATVSDDGLITAVKSGKTVITVNDHENKFSATCNVEVTSTESIEYTPYGQEKVW